MTTDATHASPPDASDRILIIGGGPVGFAVAIDLAMRGRNSTIVERDTGTGLVLLAKAGSSPLLFPNSPFPRDCDAGGLRDDRKTAAGEGMSLSLIHI